MRSDADPTAIAHTHFRPSRRFLSVIRRISGAARDPQAHSAVPGRQIGTQARLVDLPVAVLLVVEQYDWQPVAVLGAQFRLTGVRGDIDVDDVELDGQIAADAGEVGPSGLTGRAAVAGEQSDRCLLYTSPSPRD